MTSHSPVNAGTGPQKATAPAIVLLTPTDAAKVLKVSPSWLAKARMRGDGPAYFKLGRSVRYPESALVEWMKSRRRLSTSEQ
jgi:predicted DNA-binding transcriptional regulator AlpA